MCLISKSKAQDWRVSTASEQPVSTGDGAMGPTVARPLRRLSRFGAPQQRHTCLLPGKLAEARTRTRNQHLPRGVLRCQMAQIAELPKTSIGKNPVTALAIFSPFPPRPPVCCQSY